MGAVAWRWVLRVARFSGRGGGALAVLRRPAGSGARAASSSGSAVGEAGAARRGGAGGERVLASPGVGGSGEFSARFLSSCFGICIEVVPK